MMLYSESYFFQLVLAKEFQFPNENIINRSRIFTQIHLFVNATTEVEF